MNALQPLLRTKSDSAASPLARFIALTHASLAAETSGAVADYIPELSKADPAHFGIALATLDGQVYEAGDSAVPFTIQSISKAFVFALALQTIGAGHCARPRADGGDAGQWRRQSAYRRAGDRALCRCPHSVGDDQLRHV